MGHSARYSSRRVRVHTHSRDNCLSLEVVVGSSSHITSNVFAVHLIVAISVAICFCEIQIKRSARFI